MIKRIRNFFKAKNDRINQINDIYKYLNSGIKSPKINLGQMQADINNKKEKITSLSDVEFQVFSQWGDDGIIQYLINKIDIPYRTFIEFGVENYIESNTRFLLINNNWTGYVIDGSSENIQFIKNDAVSWGYELYSRAAFITKENINDLIKEVNFEKEVGILSIDIDGNDYWVWQAIDINPVIVIIEYNSVFGKNTHWTIPYDPTFMRGQNPASKLFYGASLNALISLSEQKGYTFIGCNSKGNNAYFVRNDKNIFINNNELKKEFVYSTFRETNIEGKWIPGKDRIKLLEGKEVVDTKRQEIVKINADIVDY